MREEIKVWFVLFHQSRGYMYRDFSRLSRKWLKICSNTGNVVIVIAHFAAAAAVVVVGRRRAAAVHHLFTSEIGGGVY
jgi:hypothetical protein